MGTAWRWLRTRAGRRGAFLAFLAILDVAYGWSLLTVPRAAQQFDLLLPWRVWGIIWLAAGVNAASGILLRRDRIQYAIAAAIKAAWALVWAELWVTRGAGVALVSVVVWLAFAATVVLISSWPEPVHLIPAEPPRPLP